MITKNNAAVRGQWALGAAAVALVFGIGYSVTRHKEGPAAPVAALKPASGANQVDPLEALLARTRTAPGDANAWAALGDALFAKSRFDEAVVALEKGNAIAPDRADIWSALGEARVMASPRDPMPPAALTAFRKALSIDPKDPRSRYFNAVARDLTGDHQGAIGDWMALLKDTPPGAPWENDLRRTITQVAKINKIDVTERLASIKSSGTHPMLPGGPMGLVGGGAIPGPTPEQMRAAAALTPTQQDMMAQQMVSQLEGKLRANPGNIDGWVMLMRSRKTLGENGKASRALADAIAANPAAATRLKSEAAALGIAAS